MAGQLFPVVPVKSRAPIGGDLDPATLVARISSGAKSISHRPSPAGRRQTEQCLADLARRSRSWEREADHVAGQIGQPRGSKPSGA